MEDGEEKRSPRTEGNPEKSKPVWKLYTSRFLTAWGDRLWAFGFGLFLIEIQKTNLVFLGIHGFAKCLTEILFLPAIGNWIDRIPRLRAAQILLVIQNLFVCITCLVLGLYFSFHDEIHTSEYTWLPGLIAAIVMLLSLIANLASHGSKIIVEKDWIVVISEGDENRLADLNSNLRTVDLSCQTLSPILAGLVFSETSYVTAAAGVGIWNVVSVILEYVLLVIIYRDYPELGKKVVKEDEKEDAWLKSKVTGSYRGWVSYMTHEVRNAGLGLALLYMTVLGFDTITWGYSRMQGVKEWMLGLMVAISGLVGIAGSRTFPLLRSKLGIERSGVVGLSLQLACIAMCVVSVWLPGSPFDPNKEPTMLDVSNVTKVGCDDSQCSENVDHTSIAVLLSGIILARFGLWIADLSITQILQENVAADIRGVIGGVQTSLNSTMDLVKFVFVLILPDPHTFGILILLSFSFVSLGYFSMLSYAFKKKKLCCGPKYEATQSVDPDAEDQPGQI